MYGGLQAAENYGAAALGMGKDLGSLGALSFDVTHARAKFSHDDTETGQSYRFLYSKRFDDTDTSLRWLVIVTPLKVTTPSMNGLRGVTVLKISGKPVTAAAAWKEL